MSELSPGSRRGLWLRRVGAQVLDLIIVAGIGTIIIAIVGGHPYWHLGHPSDWELTVRYLAAVVATLAYVPTILVLNHGQTVGKFLLGIAVIRQDGLAVGFWRAVWREVIIKVVLLDALAWLPTVGGTVAYIIIVADVLRPLWSSDGAALHDLASQTRVVRSTMIRSGGSPDGLPAVPARAMSETGP